MGRYLIVANQTLGGEELSRAVRDRIERGAADSRFYILVPMTAPEHEASDRIYGFAVADEEAWTPEQLERLSQAIKDDERKQQARDADARMRSEQRLAQMIEQVQAAGGEADGEVGGADPVQAVRSLLKSRSFDEVIVSTLPARISRWLKMDVPSRLSRSIEIPVTTIEARGKG